MKWNCRMNASEGNVCEAVREANSKTVVELIYCITSLLILAPFFFFFVTRGEERLPSAVKVWQIIRHQCLLCVRHASGDTGAL